MVKKGDTLIEVALAIGIFSMVAIAVVAVMTSGTSNSQTALETTLAREEIDTQAEALRFIHSSYLSDEGSGNDPYTKLWKEITSEANVYVPEEGSEDIDTYLQFSPSSCQSIYTAAADNNVNSPLKKGFIINTRDLSQLTTENTNDVYISYKNNSDMFTEASTYPRLVYNQENSLVDENTGDDVNKVEGIYVLAVADSGTTNVVGAGSKTSAYYDFYIRTCWYGTGSETPSTISTVIRLYNPANLPSDIVDPVNPSGGGGNDDECVGDDCPAEALTINFNANNGSGSMSSQSAALGDNLKPNAFTRSNYVFVGWSLDQNARTPSFYDESVIVESMFRDGSTTTTLYAVWKEAITITFVKLNGNNHNEIDRAYQYVAKNENFCLMSNPFTLEGYMLKGWSKKKPKGNSQADYVDGACLSGQDTGLTLYSIWERSIVITFVNIDDHGSELGSYTQTIARNSNANLTPNRFTRDGLHFQGWSDSKTSQNVKYEDGASVDFSGSKTLYTVWKRYIQDLTYSQCQSDASSDGIKVIDERDGNNYTARFINGVCWMTKNLAYTKDIDSNWFWFWSGGGPSAYRGMYNLYAAQMNNLCPSGWRLPTWNEAKNLGGNLNSFNPSYDGYFNSYYFHSSKTAYYWMKTGNQYAAFSIEKNGAISTAFTSPSSTYGFSVRCVRNN